MTPTPEEVLATLLREVALRKQHPELGCYECGEPFYTHVMSCPVPVIEIAAAALSASHERVRSLALYVQGRGHATTCPQATGPYDLDIYMEPSCTCGYDAALRASETPA